MPDSKRNSIANTVRVAIGLSVICSVLVAATATFLKPRQLQNAAEFRQRIILDVAGLYEEGASLDLEAAGVEARLVDLVSGDYVEDADPISYDPIAAANDPDLAVNIPAEFDVASVRRRARIAPVYLVRAGGELEQIILPVRGAGLWSTMQGYLALAADGNTIRGLQFFEHGETPGLGDQIDKPEWRELWVGKKLFSADDELQIEVVRGAGGDNDYEIDGMAGATLTGHGVRNLVHYWVGSHAYGPYLEKQRRGDGDE